MADIKTAMRSLVYIP